MGVTDEIKNRLSIESVVERYASLQRSGKNFKANCPMHNERTPSFVVDPARGTWRCFGACKDGGDVFSLVMKIHKIDFKEALFKLADEAGVTITKQSNDFGNKKESSFAQANEVAAKWFRKMLLGTQGERARNYLKGRGILENSFEKLGLGFATDGLTSLSAHLSSNERLLSEAKELRLISALSDGTTRDFFSGRVTFEIRSKNNLLVGFGARELDGSEPKYINTPKTKLFDKSKTLYGLNWAKDKIRTLGQVVVVEGYMDVITAHENGFENTVAAMGVSVTTDQILELSKALYGVENPTIVICLDADNAGNEATIRSLKEALVTLSATEKTSRTKLKVVNLDGGKDPDEVIKNSPISWQTQIDKAEVAFDYLLNAYRKSADISEVEGKTFVLNEIKPLFHTLSPLAVDSYIQKLAKTVMVGEERLKLLLFDGSQSKNRTIKRRRYPKERPYQTAPKSEQVVDLKNSLKNTTSANVIEDTLLAILVEHNGLKEHVLDLPLGCFYDSFNRQIFTQIVDGDDDKELAELEEKKLALKNISGSSLKKQDAIFALKQCRERLKQRYLKDVALGQFVAFTDGDKDTDLESEKTLGALRDSFNKVKTQGT